MRFEPAFQAACVCCKADGADVPEAEAVIRLLLPLLTAAYLDTLDAITRRAEEILQEAPGLGPEDLVLLLAAYVTTARRLAARPLSAEVSRVVANAAASLARAAAVRSGLPIPANLASAATLAAEQLVLQLEGLVEFAVERSLPEVARLAQAPLPAQPSPESRAAFIAALARALDVQDALRPLADAWAYQTFNSATVRAAAADGHNFIQLQATIDAATTAFCRLVDGRVVPMALAQAQLARIEEAVAQRDVAALMQAAPFHPNPRNATPDEVDAAIARGGLAPFHFSCRTQNVPIRLP